MAKHFEITITVAYDEATVPDGMLGELYDNVERCISNAELLNDANLEATVETYAVCVVPGRRETPESGV